MKWSKWRWPIRLAVYERDGFRCLRCGWQPPGGPPEGYDGSYALIHQPEAGPWIILTLDHVIPESQGGSFTVGNLQTLCSPCNAAKGASTADYRQAVADAV